jgi:hypothetical protein
MGALIKTPVTKNSKVYSILLWIYFILSILAAVMVGIACGMYVFKGA